MKRVDFTSHWDALWGPLKTAGGSFVTILGVIGIVLILISIAGWLWERRRSGGGGGGMGKMLFPLIIGAILSGPEWTIPVILKIAEVLVNLFLYLVDALS